ncbi:MAG TPA: Mth938-like domain-containing protein [Xylella sp.]
MLFTQEQPDYLYSLRFADAHHARINDRVLYSSFILMPDQLVEHWPVTSAEHVQASDLEPLLMLAPALVILSTGDRQIFPPVEVLATFLTRGIGVEIMANTASARTYNVLASEARRVALAMILSGDGRPL